MLKQALILFATACIYYSGLVQLVCWWRRRLGKRLIILNYHHAAGWDLRRHLLYLRRHYHVMHLEEALEELYSPQRTAKRIRDRRTPMVLTFDDGYRDNYTHGFPLACELQVPITIFLIPDYIENGNCFWWLQANRLVCNARVDQATIEGHTYHPGQPVERIVLEQMIYNHSCHAKSIAEREAFLVMVHEALEVPATTTAGWQTVLKWPEIREMEESGWVSFGAHTMHHPVLAYLRDYTEVKCEVNECRSVMEQHLGHPVRSFAYPLGKPEHVGDEGLRAVREAAYAWAVTTNYGFNTPQSDPHQLLRVTGIENTHWLLMASMVCGVWQLFIAGYQTLKGRRRFW